MELKGRRRGELQGNSTHAAGRYEVRVPGLVRDLYILNVEFLLPGLPVDVAVRVTVAQHGVRAIRAARGI